MYITDDYYFNTLSAILDNMDKESAKEIENIVSDSDSDSV